MNATTAALHNHLACPVIETFSPFGNHDLVSLNLFRTHLLEHIVTIDLKNHRDLKHHSLSPDLVTLGEFGKTPFEQSILSIYLLHREHFWRKPSSNIFLNSDVEIVEGEVGNLELKQISQRDAILYSILFNKIKEGVTNISVEGSLGYQESIYIALKTLLTRPSGRLLILSVLRSRNALLIKQSRETQLRVEIHKHGERLDKKTVYIEINDGHTCYLACLNANKMNIRCRDPFYLSLAHEILHFLHLSSSDLGYLFFNEHRVPRWDNLEEFYTISGFPFCENTLRYDFGELPRVNHSGSDLGPLNESSNLLDKESDGSPRINSAAQLGLYEEVEELLRGGGDPQVGLSGALKRDYLEIAQLCLSFGAKVDSASGKEGDTDILPISIAAGSEAVTCLQYLVEKLNCPIPLDKTETPFPPILMALTYDARVSLHFLLSKVHLQLPQELKDGLFLYAVAQAPNCLNILAGYNFKLNTDLFKKRLTILLNITTIENIRHVLLNRLQLPENEVKALLSNLTIS